MIKITVPATSANLGPGFDSLGLALNIRNTIIVKESEKELEIICRDNASEHIETDTNNLVYISIKKIFDLQGIEMPNISLELINGIPVSRGLGSSAACIAAGCTAGNIMTGSKLSINQIINIATEIEGHPDNIVPALVGGFTVSCMENEKVIHFRNAANKNLAFAVMYPEFTLPTSVSRKVLPESLTMVDAVFNISRASLLTASLISGQYNLLKTACQDRMHVPYRKVLIPNFDQVNELATEAGAYCSFLSGAGPTILAVVDKSNIAFEEFMLTNLKKLPNQWKLIMTEMSDEGILVV